MCAGCRSSRPQDTWINKRQGLALILERLDHSFCTVNWLHMFDHVHVTHLPLTLSDHHLIVLTCDDYRVGRRGFHRPFRLLFAWFLHLNFRRPIRDQCKGQETNFLKLLNAFADWAWDWNVTTLGNIFLCKKHQLARLEGTQKAFMLGASKYLESLENELGAEYIDILQQEEAYQFQKAQSG